MLILSVRNVKNNIKNKSQHQMIEQLEAKIVNNNLIATKADQTNTVAILHK